MLKSPSDIESSHRICNCLHNNSVIIVTNRLTNLPHYRNKVVVSENQARVIIGQSIRNRIMNSKKREVCADDLVDFVDGNSQSRMPSTRTYNMRILAITHQTERMIEWISWYVVAFIYLFVSFGKIETRQKRN